MSWEWQFSWLCLVGLIALPVFYFFVRQAKRLAAWSQRAPGPNERVGFFLAMFAAAGFVIGGFATAPYRGFLACTQSGKPIAACLLTAHL